jgi:hypothetical protein
MGYHFWAFLAKTACFLVAFEALLPGFNAFDAIAGTLKPAFLALAVNFPLLAGLIVPVFFSDTTGTWLMVIFGCAAAPMKPEPNRTDG